MSVRVDASEVKALARRLEKKGGTINGQASLAVRKAGHDLEARGKAQIVAMDAVDTGAMLNSTSSSVRGLTAEAGPTVDYAVYVHDGTSRVRPRPFMAAAFDEVRPGFEAALAQLAERGI